MKETTRNLLIQLAIYYFGFYAISPLIGSYKILPDIFFSQQLVWIGDLLLALAAFASKRKGPKQNNFIIVIFSAFMIFMVLNGILETDNIRIVFITDLQIYIRFFLMLILGFRWIAFMEIKKAAMVILVAGVICNLISLSFNTNYLRDQFALGLEKPIVYQIQYVLLPSCLYIFLYDKLTRTEKVIIATAFTLCAIEQLIFQKRLPTTRILLTLSVFLSLPLIFSNDISNFVQKLFKRIGIIISVLLCGIIILVYFGFSFNLYYDALVQRFFQKGDLRETIEDDTRWEIGEVFYEQLSAQNDFISGRGFGGVVYDFNFQFQDDANNSYRPNSEMGIPTLILKGGIFFAIYWGIVLIIILARSRICFKNNYSFALWAHAIIWFIFFYGEGFVSNLYNPNELFVGYAIGACLANPNFIMQKAAELSNSTNTSDE